MECYYHPDREGTEKCAICGKSICKECGLEIAGKEYCKECLEKIVGLGIDNQPEKQAQTAASPQPMKTEHANINQQPIEQNIYQPPTEEEIRAPQQEAEPVHEIKQISEDSPYNIKNNAEYSGGLETSYLQKDEQIPQMEEQPKITQNEYKVAPQNANSQEFIYPDHSYEPQPTSARVELEDKYEKYLDDLYFDENDVPLGEQLAKDEEEYGSLTRKPYQPKEETLLKEEVASKPKRPETPEEMEARIRAEILAEKEGKKDNKNNDNIHNLNYQEEKEPMGVVDNILTILLIIVVLVVIYYLIYVFTLHAVYPTFMDSIYALSNPQNVINNILTPQ